MRSRAVFVTILLAGAVTIVSPVPAGATTVQGSLSYAGQALSTTFPGLAYGRVGAHNFATQTWVYGSVDPVAGTYSVDGLTSGTWTVQVLLGADDLGSRIKPRSEEVYAWAYVDVASEITITRDLVAYYAFRITQPLDSLARWNGEIVTCPEGPAVADTFTFAWEAVPLAVRYQLSVRRYDCAGQLGSETIDPTGRSVEIEQRTVSGEKWLLVELQAYGASDELLTKSPDITYANGTAEGAYFHAAGSGGGRAPHPASSVFVPQVARLSGVPPSYWTSDVIVTNPTESDVNATLAFTPRNADGSTDYLVATMTVPAGSCRVLSDVLGSTFFTDGAGSLEVSPATLEVTSRISTPGSNGGTYGQGFPALGTGDTAALAGPKTALGVGGVAKGTFRSNLVLVEMWGEAVQVSVRLLDRDGVQLGHKTVDLSAYGNTQLNDVVGQLGGPATLAEGQLTVTVTSGAGRVGAVLSMVDNGSQDPTTLRLTPR